MIPSDYKHRYTINVRFNEVDMLGVVNNAVYLSYFETARLDYLKQLKVAPPEGLFRGGTLYFVVKNEINYKGFSRFDDELIVGTKVSYIKNSSFGFSNLIYNKNLNQIVVEGNGVIAQVDKQQKRPVPLPENFVKIVTAFEPDLKIIKN